MRDLCVKTVFFLLLGISSIAIAQENSMKLLNETSGWIATGNRIFWTTDRGNKWTEITPKQAHQKTIVSVFFLDTANGWALLTKDAEPEPLLELASTTNAGESWRINQVRISNLNPEQMILTGQGRLDFTDVMHGWIDLDVQSSSNFALGMLLSTVDGGKTWTWVKSPGVSGKIRFINTREGWLAGGPGNFELYATHDGSHSWQKISLNAPPQIASIKEPVYDLPTFFGPKEGFLPATFTGTNADLTLVLFTTSDGGLHWKADKVVPNLPEIYVGVPFPSSIADSILKIVYPNRRAGLTVTTAGANGISSASTTRLHVSQVDRVDFVTSMKGWLQAGKLLLSTDDGGSSWEDITPAPLKPSVPKASVTIPSFPLGPYAETKRIPGPNGASSPGVSIHIGFDKCDAPDANPSMVTWWRSSPFYDYGVYIGGNSRSCSNVDLTSTWVSNVRGQGWGLIPVWVGPQAPCACRPNQPVPCAHFPNTFSSDPGQASTDGANEADKATAQAVALGLGPQNVSNDIIYYDIENYSSSQCGAAVQAFVDGWDTEMHNLNYAAGVYGNPGPAQNDFSNAYVPPDDVWIAKYLTWPQVTIWNLSPLCDRFSANPCSLWSSDQRIHQFKQNYSETWGGINISPIDVDIEDARIVNNGTATKSYNFGFTNVDYPGQQTGARAINDISPTGAFISTSAQVGEIVGVTSASFGFLDVGGTFTTINCPSGAGTQPFAINSKGEIAGICYPSGSSPYGFLITSGGTFVSVNYPSAMQTYVTGVNDADQIVGFFVDTGYNYHGFLYNYGGNHQFSQIDFPGALWTEPYGINGSGQIVGTYGDSSDNPQAFIFNAGSDSSYVYFQYAYQNGEFGNAINNNGLMLGFTGTVNNINTNFIYDQSSNVLYTFPDDPSGQSGWTFAFGLNDYAQVVGSYVITNGDGHGFVAVPQ